MSGHCEQDKCDFCQEIKIVERTYLRPTNFIKPESPELYLKLYNEGNYFIIIKTCADCGVPVKNDENKNKTNSKKVICKSCNKPISKRDLYEKLFFAVKEGGLIHWNCNLH